MLAAVLAVALSQWGPEPSPGMQQYDPGSVCQRTGGRCFLNRSGNRPRENYAFFEFAPSSGAGMGTACACTTPTGAKGDALTFTRAGDATCSKQGLATTGIANGDLVVCTANQPRVESSGGVLGLRVEGARTNVLPRSQELDNAAWILDFAGGGVIPTRTANAATAPDGTVTAERLQFSACASAGDASLIYQLHATSGASASTIFCRGNGSTVTISVCSFGSTGSSGCTPVSCPSTSWSRGQDIRTASGTGGLVVGCNNLATYTGASNTGAADVFLWQAQQEMGATYATSPIPTVASAEARNAEAASFLSVSTSPRCVSGSFQVPYTVVDASRRIANPTNAGGTSQLDLFVSTGSAAVAGFAFDGVDFRQPVTANLISAAPTVNRAYFYYVPSTTAAVALNGGTEAVLAGGAVDPVTTDRVGIGVYVPGAAGTELNGIVSLVQVDPSTTRCR